MKIEIKGKAAYIASDATLRVDVRMTKVRLAAHYSYPDRDQSTVLLTRDQALQLAGALQLLAWRLNDQQE